MTTRAGTLPPAAVSLESADSSVLPSTRPSFHVHLENFEGPFDLLLQLIGQRRMDVTDVALHTVTDDFIRHIRTMGPDVDLGVVTEFLVVAATLLDLKAARLLPDGEVEDNADIDLLEARDLLFARLLAYRAYQQVTVLFQELEASALRRYPRAVTLEDRYLGLLPEVQLGMDAETFAELATSVFRPKPPPPGVSLDHIHSSPVSVAAHTAAIRELLELRRVATFGELIAGCTQTMEVIARFLGLLNLFREAAVAFDQPEPLGLLTVRWTGDEADPAGIAVDEEYE
ncbi:condensin subunit ScpA [Nakamurella panacisegetis]|uniref:Segregation and condensation protein A n=1 Tax=Nakamurella panacisegetis TaxID=1090615 RepID=A0A1H0PTU0_9ACTN|nr:segregation/condensation protein A [Nakamurella panacisegetis]SDP07928.1 condensin subunit ScpA [Nakamurella panacisegetis]